VSASTDGFKVVERDRAFPAGEVSSRIVRDQQSHPALSTPGQLRQIQCRYLQSYLAAMQF
jgi:hypothetical protein